MGSPISFDIFARDVNASQTFDKVADHAESSGSRMGKLAGWAKGGVVALGALGVAGGIAGLKTAAGMENAQIAFTTMLGSATEADAFIKKLANFAAKTPFEFPGLQQSASSLISAGISADKVIPIMTTLGNVTSGMGTGAEGIDRATVALQQMTAAGKITGEDLNQLRDAGIPVYDLLASATGKSKSEVVALAQAGKLGARELAQMMKALETGKGLERFSGLMEKQSQSLGGVWSTLMDTVNMGLAKAIQPALPGIKSLVLAVSGGLGPAFSAAGKGVSGLVGLFGRLKGAGGANVGGAFKRTGAALAGFGRAIMPTLRTLGGKLMDTIGPALSQLGNVVATQFLPAFRRMLPIIAPIAKFLLKVFGGAVIGALKGVINVITGVVRVISGIFNVISGVVRVISGIFNVISGVLTGDWSRVWKGLGQIVKGAGQAILGVIQFIWNVGIINIFRRGAAFLLKGLWVKLWAGLKGAAKNAIPAIGAAIRSGLTAIGRAFVAGVRSYLGIWRNGFKVLRSAFGGAWRAIRTVVSQTLSAIRGVFVRAVGWITGVWRSGLSKLASLARSGIGRVVGFFKGLPRRILNSIGNLVGRMSGLGRSIVEGLVNGVKNAAHLVVDAAKNLADHIPNWVKKGLGIASPSRVMMRLGSFVTQGLARGILGRGWSELDSALNRLVKRMTQTRDRIHAIMSARNEFAGGFAGLATSVFGGDYGEAGPKNMSDLLAQAQGERSQASSYSRDLVRAIGLGLSNNLLRDLQSNGDGGRAALHAIATTGTRRTVAQLNRTDADTDAIYGFAGRRAAYELYGTKLSKARAEYATEQRLMRGLKGVMHELAKELKDAKNGEIILRIDGKDIKAVVHSDDRKKGKRK